MGLTGKKKGDDNLKAAPGEAARAVMLQVDTRVVLATPRDTGRAANNWLPGVGQAVQISIGAEDPFPSSQSRWANLPVQPGITLHLTNNLPYIERLNEGYSQQAPTGYVQRAIRRAIATTRKDL